MAARFILPNQPYGHSRADAANSAAAYEIKFILPLKLNQPCSPQVLACIGSFAIWTLDVCWNEPGEVDNSSFCWSFYDSETFVGIFK